MLRPALLSYWKSHVSSEKVPGGSTRLQCQTHIHSDNVTHTHISSEGNHVEVNPNKLSESLQETVLCLTNSENPMWCWYVLATRIRVVLQLTSYLGTMWALNWFPYPFEVSTVRLPLTLGVRDAATRSSGAATGIAGTSGTSAGGAGTLPSSSPST